MFKGAILPGKSSGSLVSIQLLRAIAAIVVVFGHAQTEAFQANGAFSPTRFDFGIGVDVFFIVSGFVMVISSAKLIGTAGAAGTFIRKRLWRVVPLYWFYTCGMLLAIAIFPSALNNAAASLPMVISSFLFLPFPNANGEYLPVLALGWTLNYEMFFYALFAIALLRRNARWLEVVWLLIMAAMILGAALPGTAFGFWGNPIIAEFLIGVLLAKLWQHSPCQRSAAMFALCLLTAAVLYVVLSPIEGLRLVSHGIPSAVFSVGLIFFLPLRLEQAGEGFARVVGDSSYSLYLSHPFVLAILRMVWGKFDPDFMQPWTYVLVATAACVVAGYASYILIEKPAIRLARRPAALPA